MVVNRQIKEQKYSITRRFRVGLSVLNYIPSHKVLNTMPFKLLVSTFEFLTDLLVAQTQFVISHIVYSFYFIYIRRNAPPLKNTIAQGRGVFHTPSSWQRASSSLRPPIFRSYSLVKLMPLPVLPEAQYLKQYLKSVTSYASLASTNISRH